MLRERLRHPLSERRRPRRAARRAVARVAKSRRRAGAQAASGPAPRHAAQREELLSPADPVQRERAAAAPLDRACYVCACGFVFQAAVSTDVSCPHCGGRQAW